MLDSVISWTLKHRIGVVLAMVGIAFSGLLAIRKIPIDAVPDITNVQVVISTKTGALDPSQIEKTVTHYIETEVSGVSNVEDIRSVGRYGLSQVIVVFHEGTDINLARQQISERLQNLQGQLPPGVVPELGPISTGLGEVFIYTLLPKPGSALASQSEEEQLIYLRTIQDRRVRPWMKQVENVAEIDTIGGFQKEIHIELNIEKMAQNAIAAEDVLAKLDTLGENVGGGYINDHGKQVVVRTKGDIHSLEHIQTIPIKQDVYGHAILLNELATVKDGYAPRVGAATYNGKEAVICTVIMRAGANSRQVAIEAEKKLGELQLPEDVIAKPLYSRQFLVDCTIRTVVKNLLEGALLVVFILFLILNHFRAALVVALAIPVSMLFAAKGMSFLGISANLMSLGAIDFGLLVDASVVMIENVLRNMEKHEGEHLTAQERYALVLKACQEVVKPVSVGMLIIMVVYIPILQLHGIEGKMFKPMAITVLMALGSSLSVGVLLMPILAYITLRNKKVKPAWLYHHIYGHFEPLFKANIKHPKVVQMGALCLGIAAIFTFTRLGSDFIPILNEGDMLATLIRDNTMALAPSIEAQKKSDEIIMRFPEVDHVFSRMGTPEAATDIAGVNNSDTFIILKKGQKMRSQEALSLAIQKTLESEIKGQEVSVEQPIQLKFNDLLEGTRSDVVVRIFGPDLEALSGYIRQAQKIVEPIKGISNCELDALADLEKGPVLDVQIDFNKVLKYGLQLSQVNQIVEATMGGRTVGSFYENDWRFPIVVKLSDKTRDGVRNNPTIPIRLAEGGSIPLSAVATLTQRQEVTSIAHSYGQRFGAVSIFLSGRDMESFVKEAKKTLDAQLILPKGYHVEWGGQFKNLHMARERLLIVFPLTLLVVFVFLLYSLKSWAQTLLVFLSIPFAMTGGVFALYLRHIHFSISAAVGFIALSGIAILNAMVLVNFYNQLRQEGKTTLESVVEGTLLRFRPVLMTMLVASLGFFPMAFNTGIGAEIQRPLATVVIGGLLTAMVLTLFLLPTLYLWVEKLRARTP